MPVHTDSTASEIAVVDGGGGEQPERVRAHPERTPEQREEGTAIALNGKIVETA